MRCSICDDAPLVRDISGRARAVSAATKTAPASAARPWAEGSGATPYLEIKGLSKRFAGFTAVDNISLDISDSTLDSNTADYGGGIHLYYNDSADGENVTFTNNDPDDLYTYSDGAETLGKKADFSCTDDGC